MGKIAILVKATAMDLPASRLGSATPDGGKSTAEELTAAVATAIVVDIRNAEERAEGPTVEGSLHLEW